jgi:hypothetical protein
MRRWRNDPVRMWKARILLLSAHHFLQYARQTADELEHKALAWSQSQRSQPSGPANSLPRGAAHESVASAAK